MEAVLIAASGGLDSTTLIWHAAIQPGTLVYCVHFQYGSKHNQHEEKAIAKLKERTPVNVRFHSHKVILDDIFHGGRSSLLNTGNVIPEGHYEEETMKSTVVPGRNLVLIAACASIAEAKGIGTVWLGTHAGDHYIYPDCRLEFIRAADKAVQLSTLEAVKVEAPFIDKSKVDIVKLGWNMGVPFMLTRTCYKDGDEACGRCGSCQERLEAFHKNNLEDPLLYDTRVLLPKKGSRHDEPGTTTDPATHSPHGGRSTPGGIEGHP